MSREIRKDLHSKSLSSISGSRNKEIQLNLNLNIQLRSIFFLGIQK